MLGTELGAKAVFSHGHAPVLSSKGQRSHPLQHNLVGSAKMERSIGYLYGSPGGTSYIRHLIHARPPRPEDHHLPSHGLGSHNTLHNGDAVVCVNCSPCSGPISEPSHPCLPLPGVPRLTTQTKFWDQVLLAS